MQHVEVMVNNLRCILIGLNCAQQILEHVLSFLKLIFVSCTLIKINYAVFIKVQCVELVVNNLRCILIGLHCVEQIISFLKLTFMCCNFMEINVLCTRLNSVNSLIGCTRKHDSFYSLINHFSLIN